MNPQLPDGDTIVALAGIAMALMLVSRNTAMIRLSSQRKVLYALIWAVLFGVVAALAARFTG